MPASRRSEFWSGVRDELPLLVGVAPFGMAYGALAVEAGVSAAMAQAMSVIVFAGASQIVAVELVGSAPAAVLVLTVLLVNLRHLLYGASLAPRVEALPLRWRWLLAYLLTDEAYAVTIARYERDGSPYAHWYFLGAGVALWATWQITTGLGVFAGAAVPESWSLDFALPLTFIAILVPALRTRSAVGAAAAAALVASLGVRWPYGLGLLGGALAGLTAGLAGARVFGERERRPAQVEAGSS
ncbi:MAG TPA: AzlC family ABC transporter permease [Dehalococcoidia bacterium]|nr:AzlC family ABC transporter permease [Dehalococcoidia bacterium]